MTHELKIKAEYLKEITEGNKNFELRRNDRDFKVGDWLHLREYINGQYTGRFYTVLIKYILKDCPEYGLMNGYCILGF